MCCENGPGFQTCFQANPDGTSITQSRKRQSTVPITSLGPFSFFLLVAIGTNAQALPTLTVRFRGSTQRLGDAVGVGAEPGVIVLGPVADSAGNSQLRAISQFAADGAIIIGSPLMVIGSSSGSPTSASANCF